MKTAVTKTGGGKYTVRLSKANFVELAKWIGKCRAADESAGFLRPHPFGPGRAEIRVMANLVKDVHDRCARLYLVDKKTYALTMGEAEALAIVWSFLKYENGPQNWQIAWNAINLLHQKLS